MQNWLTGRHSNLLLDISPFFGFAFHVVTVLVDKLLSMLSDLLTLVDQPNEVLEKLYQYRRNSVSVLVACVVPLSIVHALFYVGYVINNFFQPFPNL